LRITLKYHRLEKSVQKLTGGGLFRLLTIALLLLLLYQTSTLVKIVNDTPSFNGLTAVYPTAPTVDIANEGKWITVAGSAPDFAVAVLLADGKERDFCAINEGRYSFTFKSDGRIHSFQIQVYGNAVPAMYTRAIPAAGLQAGSTADTGTLRSKTAEKPAAGKETAAVHEPEGSSKLRPKSLPEYKPADDLSRGLSGTNTVAITFDGGSYSNAASRILDVLAERGLKATFFLTGEFMKRYPDITRRIANEGHEVGNHMYNHLHLTTFAKNYRQDTLPGITRELVQKELIKNEKLFHEITGKKMVKLWRAPYGEQNATIRSWAHQVGYRHVSWTYDPKTKKSLDGLDWVSDRHSALYLSSEDIVKKIISFDSETKRGLDGGIVLLHLGTDRKNDPFYPKLGELIDRLQEKGYKVGSVTQVLGTGG